MANNYVVKHTEINVRCVGEMITFAAFVLFVPSGGKCAAQRMSKPETNVKRYLLITLGSLSLGLGVIGIFLPLLPTTPFLLLAASCYVNSSPALYAWLLKRKYLGEYIRSFREHRAIPLRAKVVSVSLVWATLLYCAVFVVSHLLLRFIFILLAAGVTVHILSYNTLRKPKKKAE